MNLLEQAAEIAELDSKRTPGEWLCEGSGGIQMDGIRDAYAIGVHPWKGYHIARLHSREREQALHDGNAIAALPRAFALIASMAREIERLRSPKAKPLSEYHEDRGAVCWFSWDAQRNEWRGEPAYVGAPESDDWPGYHTHFIPHPRFPPPPKNHDHE